MFEKIETKNEFGEGIVMSWASIIDEKTMEQAAKLSRLPIVRGHVALMPDAHFGYGPPVGTALVTVDAVMPYAVGVDIGCGMIAAKTSLKRGDFYGKEGQVLAQIRTRIPSGVGQSNSERSESADEFVIENDWPRGVLEGVLNDTEELRNKILLQFGTLGAGNHFVEVCSDYDANVWFVIHSGSRGIGNMLATAHSKRAQEYCEMFDIQLEDKEFAYFPSSDPYYHAYLDDMLWAQKYAFGQREAMLTALISGVQEAIGPFTILEKINCHHNYAEEIESSVWLTRKGAIDANVDVMGVIPGSMGDSTYIVSGLGNEEAYNTSPHGAGRILSRGAAIKTVDKEAFRTAMQGKTWLDRDIDKLLDEAPAAYKPINTVIADSRELVIPTTMLQQFINYKGL